MESVIVRDIADILIHVDENLDDVQRAEITHELRTIEGVVSVSNHKTTAHLLIVKYHTEQVNSSELLAGVKKRGVHAELVGI